MSIPAEFLIRPAYSFLDALEAFRIAHNQYCKYELMSSHSSELRFFLRELLPSSLIFIAQRNGDTVGTITGVIRGDAGLPSDKTFDDFFRQSSLGGPRYAEATKLACLPEASFSGRGFGERSLVVCELLRWVFWWYEHNKVTGWIAAIHPDHTNLWRDVLGFQFLASVHSYGHVEGKPCDLYLLDMESLRSGKREPSADVSSYILDNPLTEEAFRDGYVFCDRDIMMLLLEFPEVLLEADRFELRALRAMHPLPVNCAERLLELRLYDDEGVVPVPALDYFKCLLGYKSLRPEQSVGRKRVHLRLFLESIVEILEISATIERKRFSCRIAENVPQYVSLSPLEFANTITDIGVALLELCSPGERVAMEVHISHSSFKDSELTVQYLVPNEISQHMSALKLRLVRAPSLHVASSRDNCRVSFSVACVLPTATLKSIGLRKLAVV